MKKKQRQKLLQLVFISFAWFCLAPEAKADTNTALLRQIRDATQITARYVNSILSSLQSTGKQVLEALTKPTPQINDVIKANTQIAPISSKRQLDNEQRLTLQAISDILTNAPSQTNLLTLPGPDFPSYLQLNAPASPGSSPFDLDTLLSKVAFSDGAMQDDKDKNCQSKPGPPKAGVPLCQSYAARGFIGYVSGLINPPLVPAFSGLKAKGVTETQAEQFRTTVKVQNYLAELRSYTTAQSVGINNFYHLYAQRVIQPGLGKKLHVRQPGTGSGKAGPFIQDVSPLQAEEYLAKRRVSDPDWYKDMETTTSPLTLARETLYVLAEIRLELFKTRLENQRLLAAISTLQLQGLKAQKPLLDQQASGIELPKSPAASSPPPETPA